MTLPPGSRAERRQQTEARILAAAGRLFAETGYDRTTIRAVAAAADSDPGLVMRYFGSKEKLFARAVTIPDDEPIAGDSDQVAELLLAALGKKLESEPAAAVAALRSMLTHPETGAEVRAAMSDQQNQAAASMRGDDAVLRAGLIGAVTIGVVISRHLLQLDGVRDASAEEITTLLRPCFEHLVRSSAT
jgi:AcrR family transcriptional regulator